MKLVRILPRLLSALALSAACGAEAHARTSAPLRDAAHDFDFDLGAWKTHITRRLHPLTGSTATMELTGTVMVHKLWEGRSQVEEIEADGPKGHWEGMTVFLYDRAAGQRRRNFANSAAGKFTHR